jgi:CheY-like chemotaxis protein
MRSALHLLRSGSVDDKRARGLLETMDRQVAQMSRLVEDLLDISRITRGVIELRREPLDVATAIRDALESCEGPLQAGQHQVEVDLPQQPISVMADRARLQQIFENLLLNAAKYTEAGGRIVLSASSDEGFVTIQVKDNGIGIAPDKVPQVFELFVQVDESPERTRRGLGIGLALVKDLVTRHGGTVHANSDGLGKGSTFSVRLPLAIEERRQASAPSPDQAPCLAGRRVLVVDDNIDAAETLVMMLDTLGQQTRQCHDGNNAVALAAEFKPEVVFMDIGLPGMSGHEAAARMRKELGLTDAYLVALSGYGTEEDKRKSLTAGFDHHLVKPLDPTALPGILATAERRR